MKNIAIFILILSLFSCVYQKKSAMSHLFNLKIGYGENELGILSNEEVINKNSLNVFYINGFYYISDGENNKILKMTEKGIPVLIIYNPDSNPMLKPTVFDKDETSDQQTLVFVKLYKDFPVYSPGLITADIEKNIYFINKLPLYRKINDDGTVFEQMILKFNSKGELLYEIGQNGISSTPFGYIMNMQTDNKSNLIVQENIPEGVLIYKFTPDGTLLKKSEINKNKIPLSSKENTYLAEIVDTKIGYFENEIYLTVQYIKETEESLSPAKYETMYEKIFKFNIVSQQFDPKPLLKINPQYIDLTKYSSNTSEIKDLYGDKQRIIKPLETFIGIDEYHNMYFSQKDIMVSTLNRNDEILYIYNSGGSLIKNISVKYQPKIKYASDMFFSSSGRIYSYFMKDGEINFVLIN